MNYLDTNKSVMISAPAGSGKTERLARRYIALLGSGVDVERILAITFTDKAAAEMKQRILEKLKAQDRKLFDAVLDRMPLMRVSTIHSFCGTLLRRFSFEARIDPNYRIEEATDANMAWEEVLYQVLMDAGKGLTGHSLLLETLGEKGFSGLYYLKSTLDYLFQKTPFSLQLSAMPDAAPLSNELIEELRCWQGAGDAIDDYEGYFESTGPSLSYIENLFLTDKKSPRKRPAGALKQVVDYPAWAARMYAYWKSQKLLSHRERTARILDIYTTCIEEYTQKKRNRGMLDFSDLEYCAFRMLTDTPEWAAILYAFDEKTDHLLVDEFQDTNSFQWEIINSLTEEWRSGMGAKRDSGIQPTLFYVGDEKQSIYYFRGANIEIFSGAKEKMHEWLGEEFAYEEAIENYRSRPAIVAFTNHCFSRIMSPGPESPSWVTRYSPFRAMREGLSDPGTTELIILQKGDRNTHEARQQEAAILAQKIQSLAGCLQIADHDAGTRPCAYSDMAVLLRKRTHLQAYEEALRRNGVPFVAVKGIGFYQETEIATVRALLFFLSNRKDDYSLYVLLKSPFFRFSEELIHEVVNHDGSGLMEKLVSSAGDAALKDRKQCGDATLLLQEWTERAAREPLSGVIEHALVTSRAWHYYHGPQEQANIKKFIRIVEDLEAQGKSFIRIRDFLERTSARSDEPKANVNTEGMNAVKIMTIHSAKGLEFPIVFLPGLDEPFSSHRGDSLLYEQKGKFSFKSITEASIRSEDSDFLLHRAKEEEEQKRLFYVAVTRAEDALLLTGYWECPDNSLMDLLKGALDIEQGESGYTAGAEIPGFSIVAGSEMPARSTDSGRKAAQRPAPERLAVSPVTIHTPLPWKSVTASAEIQRQHGMEWGAMGSILHALFEGVSSGRIQDEDIHARAEVYLQRYGFRDDNKVERLGLIIDQIETLKKQGVWEAIITPRDGSFAELPFVYETGGVVYNGRIDRVIKRKDTYHVYDYKTVPVSHKEIDYLVKEYAFQLMMYKNAVTALFETEAVRSYIVFTHTGQVREV